MRSTIGTSQQKPHWKGLTRILEQLCKENIGWDDAILDELWMPWKIWGSELPLLEVIGVPRCFKVKGMDSLNKIELHHFLDASTEGYGQCSYLCLVDTSDQVHCSLVIGKARVTPLKLITIPRFDLTATPVSIRLSGMLNQKFRCDELEEMFRTDSKVVQVMYQTRESMFHQISKHEVFGCLMRHTFECLIWLLNDQ